MALFRGPKFGLFSFSILSVKLLGSKSVSARSDEDSEIGPYKRSAHCNTLVVKSDSTGTFLTDSALIILTFDLEKIAGLL